MKTLTPQQKWAVKQMAFAEVLKELAVHFETLGVEWMPIKGAYLIMAGLAEKIPAREMIDVDILVREKDYERVYTYLGNLPGKRLAPTSWPLDRSAYDYEVAVDGTWGGISCGVEIHRALGFPWQFKMPAVLLFSYSTALGSLCRIPTPEMALNIALCHQINHIAHQVNTTLAADITAITGHPLFAGSVFWEIAHKVCSAGSIPFLFQVLNLEIPSVLSAAPGKKTLYGYFVSQLFIKGGFYSLPLPLRRLLIEIPLVLKPEKHLMQGAMRKIKRKSMQNSQ